MSYTPYPGNNYDNPDHETYFSWLLGRGVLPPLKRNKGNGTEREVERVTSSFPYFKIL